MTVALEVFANLPSTTVTSGGTDAPSSGTVQTWTVASSAGFPAASSSALPATQFHIADTAAQAETILVTNVSGTTWTVTRGADGTTPVSHASGFTVTQVISEGWLNDVAARGGPGDWLNAVTNYGADPSGATDSTTALQNMLTDAGKGATTTGVTSVAYLQSGAVFQTSAPLTIPPGVALISGNSNEVSTGLDFLDGAVIQPSASFSQGSAAGNAVLLLVGEATGSYTVPSVEQKITSIMIDGSKLPSGNTTDGIQLYGAVSRVNMYRVLVSTVGGNGINCVEDGSGNLPDALRGERVNVRYAGATGFNIYRVSDCTFTDCLAENCAGDGWSITNASNSTYLACRSEHNNIGYVYTSTQDATGSGGGKFVGCSTDRNTEWGMQITSSDSTGTPLILSGCAFRRDGRNGNSGGGSYSGLYITSYPGNVTIDAMTIFPGVDDDGTGTNSPQYGMILESNTGTATSVLVGSAYIQGATTAISDDGTSNVLYGNAVITATGATSAPSVTFTPQIASVYAGTVTAAALRVYEGTDGYQGVGTLTAGSVTVANTSVTGTSRIFLTAQSVSGSAGALYVADRTAGTSFTVASTSATDTSSFAYEIFESAS